MNGLWIRSQHLDRPTYTPANCTMAFSFQLDALHGDINDSQVTAEIKSRSEPRSTRYTWDECQTGR